MLRLPLFPLNAVLFPGAELPLHIFEERYRVMIGRCLEDQKPFGVVLIREGHEVGEHAVPYLVGTMAEIESAYRLEDGRLYIVTQGRQRFRINYPVAAEPYLVGMVTLLDEEPGDESAAQALNEMYAHYHRLATAATGMASPFHQLPTDPLELSYAMADLMHVPLVLKQHWLELTTSQRLASLRAAIANDIQLLPTLDPRLLKREPPFKTTSWN